MTPSRPEDSQGGCPECQPRDQRSWPGRAQGGRARSRCVLLPRDRRPRRALGLPFDRLNIVGLMWVLIPQAPSLLGPPQSTSFLTWPCRWRVAWCGASTMRALSCLSPPPPRSPAPPQPRSLASALEQSRLTIVSRLLLPSASPQLYDPLHKSSINSISRAALSAALLSRAEAHPNVNVHFSRKIARIDWAKRKALVEGEKGAWEEPHEGEGGEGWSLCVAADGTWSKVRASMLMAQPSVLSSLPPPGPLAYRSATDACYLQNDVRAEADPPRLDRATPASGDRRAGRARLCHLAPAPAHLAPTGVHADRSAEQGTARIHSLASRRRSLPDLSLHRSRPPGQVIHHDVRPLFSWLLSRGALMTDVRATSLQPLCASRLHRCPRYGRQGSGLLPTLLPLDG